MMFCDDERAFEAQLTDVKKTQPILVNCHPGRDWFGLDRSVQFFENVRPLTA